MGMRPIENKIIVTSTPCDNLFIHLENAGEKTRGAAEKNYCELKSSVCKMYERWRLQ